MRPWIRISAIVGTAVTAAAVAFLAIRRPAPPAQREGERGHEDGSHGASAVVPPPTPSELLGRLVDRGAAVEVPEIRVFGRLEGPGISEPGPRIEETATWPDRWERRVVLSGDVAWVRLAAGQISRSPHVGTPGIDLSADDAWLRLRAVFCLRHLSAAARGGAAASHFDLAGKTLGAFSLSDGRGRFRLLVGGVGGGLRGIDGPAGQVLFTAHLRTGYWMYPASQALVKDGRIVEIVRVVSTELPPGI